MKRQEAILQSKRATTELVEIKKALMAHFTPATDEPAKEGGEPNPAIAKTFTLEEWKAIAADAPRHGEGVRCGRGGFFKRSQRSEALQCYHMFANTKKAPLQRFCFLS